MVMRLGLIAIGLAMVACGGARGGTSESGNTTVVRNGNGVTVIRQSGDPANAEVHVEKAPGRTTVYRHSDGNTAIVTQSTMPSELGPRDVPRWMQRFMRPWRRDSNIRNPSNGGL